LEIESNNTTDKLLIDVKEAAWRLSLSQSQVRSLIRTGEIPSYKKGRRTLIKPEDLIDFKDHLEVNTFDDPDLTI
jgi:excisionase family DNA binding protein